MPELFGDCDILSAIEEMDLLHRHDDFCATLSDSDDFCYLDDDFSPETILLEHDTNDDIAFMLNSLNETSSTKGHHHIFNTPSEAIWDKFDLLDAISKDSDEICIPTPSIRDESVDLVSQKLSSSMESLSSTPREIRHHDCMWAGKCSNEEHASDDTLTPPMSPLGIPMKQQKVTITSVPTLHSRSVLNPLRLQQHKLAIASTATKCVRIVRTTNLEAKIAINKIVRERMQNPSRLLDSEGEEQRPDTPVSDFDEQNSLFHAINSEEDSADDYYSDASDSQSRQIKRDGFENDHSYHMVSTSAANKLNADTLGVQTPSDSEEEIDVVSLGGGGGDLLQQSRLHSPIPSSSPMTISKPIKCSPRVAARTNLPTNPSPSDKHTLQHCLTEAIAKRPQRVSVPPLRIRIDSKKRANTGNTTDNESSSTESAASSSSSTRKRGKIHRRAATFDTASSSSTTSSPRKRGSRSGSDSEDSGKRTMHNTMERQRRVDLRIAFENLRTLLPKLQEQEKAPKVHILKEAGIYCRQLQMSDTNMTRKAIDLKKKQAQLRDRVSQLRKSLAFKR